MATFRLPKISDSTCSRSTASSEQQTQQTEQKRRRISTGSMRGSLPGSIEPSPPAADRAKLAGRRRSLKRSMSVPGLSLSLTDVQIKRGLDVNSRGSSSKIDHDQEQLEETKRMDMRFRRAEREFRAVSAKVSDFCTRAAAASVEQRVDGLIDTVDCMEDSDIAAERLFMNNTVLRRQRRPGFMPNIGQASPGAVNQQRDSYLGESSPQPTPNHASYGLPPDHQPNEDEAATEMVERISRWLEDVERLKRDPSEDLASGISLVALT